MTEAELSDGLAAHDGGRPYSLDLRAVQNCVLRAVGYWLVLAAMLKSQVIWQDLSAVETLALPVELMWLVIGCEIVLGVLLVFFTNAAGVLWSTAGLFMVFGAYSLVGYLKGASVCGCLGLLSVSPGLILAADLGIVLLSADVLARRNRTVSTGQRLVSWTVTLSTAILLLSVIAVGVSAHVKRDSFLPLSKLGWTAKAMESLKATVDAIVALNSPRPGWSGTPRLTNSGDVSWNDIFEESGVSHIEAVAISNNLADVALLNASDPKAIVILQGEQFCLALSRKSVDGDEYWQVIADRGPPKAISDSVFRLTDIRAAWLLRPRSPRGASFSIGEANLTVSQFSHNFGIVRGEGPFIARFTIHNNGSSDIQLVDRPRISCKCISASTDAATIAPGGHVNCEVVAEIDRNGLRQRSQVRLADKSTGLTRDVFFEVIGSRLQEFDFYPEAIDFGTVERNSPASRTLHLVGVNRLGIQSVRLVPSSLPLRCEVIVDKDDPTRTRIEISASVGDLEQGELSGAVEVVVFGGDAPALEIPVKLSVPYRTNLSPSMVRFGVENRRRSDVIVSVPKGSDPDIDFKVVGDAPVECDLEPLDASAGKFRLVVRHRAESPFSGRIKLSVRGSDWSENQFVEVCAVPAAFDAKDNESTIATPEEANAGEGSTPL